MQSNNSFGALIMSKLKTNWYIDMLIMSNRHKTDTLVEILSFLRKKKVNRNCIWWEGIGRVWWSRCGLSITHLVSYELKSRISSCVVRVRGMLFSSLTKGAENTHATCEVKSLAYFCVSQGCYCIHYSVYLHYLI